MANKPKIEQVCKCGEDWLGFPHEQCLVTFDQRADSAEHKCGYFEPVEKAERDFYRDLFCGNCIHYVVQFAKDSPMPVMVGDGAVTTEGEWQGEDRPSYEWD